MKTLKPMREIHLGKTGKVSDKWEGYFRIYDRLFLDMRTKEGCLLEIGVQNGGSLETWADYFSNFTKIVGVDIDEKCKQLVYSDPRVRVIISNATSPQILEQIAVESNNWEIIIDDGSHLPYDVIKTFLLLFPTLRPGGIYVIEDTHTFYAEVPGGGMPVDNAGFQMFKRLTDTVNRQFWDQQYDWRFMYQYLFPNINSIPAILNADWIKSVQFYNSMIVIEKEDIELRSKLGNRYKAGSETEVQDWSRTGF